MQFGELEVDLVRISSESSSSFSSEQSISGKNEDLIPEGILDSYTYYYTTSESNIWSVDYKTAKNGCSSTNRSNRMYQLNHEDHPVYQQKRIAIRQLFTQMLIEEMLATKQAEKTNKGKKHNFNDDMKLISIVVNDENLEGSSHLSTSQDLISKSPLTPILLKGQCDSPKVNQHPSVQKPNSYENRIHRNNERKRSKFRPSKKICKYLLEGSCNMEKCQYKHDLKSIQCKFWARGLCYNLRCPFKHS